MTKGCLGVVAAMPEEIRPLLARLGRHQRDKIQGFNCYGAQLGGTPVLIVESGMGPRHAAAATEALIAHAAPRAIVNFGFAGAVLPGLAVEDIVLAERAFWLEAGRFAEVPKPDPDLSARILHAASAALAVKEGTFVTAASIMNKKDVAGRLPEGVNNPILEMETAAVLRAAAAAGVPAAALRSISDAADEELGFSLEEFCDAELNIRLSRVLACVARKPRIIPQLLRLSGNTKRAGRQLALAVEAALKALAKA